ncbi:MAG TPA: hypothetical protein VF383_07265 [Candidatus Dormibacteraeota bacterium]
MTRPFGEVLNTTEAKTLDMRHAAYVQAVSRVASATQDTQSLPLDVSR